MLYVNYCDVGLVSYRLLYVPNAVTNQNACSLSVRACELVSTAASYVDLTCWSDRCPKSEFGVIHLVCLQRLTHWPYE
jgi:hypothetical protein